MVFFWHPPFVVCISRFLLTISHPWLEFTVKNWKILIKSVCSPPGTDTTTSSSTGFLPLLTKSCGVDLRSNCLTGSCSGLDGSPGSPTCSSTSPSPSSSRVTSPQVGFEKCNTFGAYITSVPGSTQGRICSLLADGAENTKKDIFKRNIWTLALCFIMCFYNAL